MNNIKLLIILVCTALLAGTAMADSGEPQTAETQGIRTTTVMELLGTAMETDRMVIDINDGYQAGGWPPAPPIAPTSVLYTSSYREDTIADQGVISYTKSMDVDTAGMVAENQYNLEADRIAVFIGMETGRMSSEEDLLLDGAGAGQDTISTLICPFATQDLFSIIPPFCNVVQEGSEVDLTAGTLTTHTAERFIMVAVPDDIYGMAWPWPVSDPGVEADYEIILTGPGGAAPAVGSASAYISAHIQEGRVVLEDSETEEVEYPLSADLVYSERTSVSGAIDMFHKDMNYLSKFTGPAGRWIEEDGM